MAATANKLAPTKVNVIGLIGGSDTDGLDAAKASPDHIILQAQVESTNGTIFAVKVFVSNALTSTGRVADDITVS